MRLLILQTPVSILLDMNAFATYFYWYFFPSLTAVEGMRARD
jgi:hypothetical protein